MISINAATRWTLPLARPGMRRRPRIRERQRRDLRGVIRIAIRPGLALALGSVTLEAQSNQLPWRVLETTTVGRDVAMGSIASAAMGSDGSVYVADFFASEILHFDPSGRLAWRAGRKGQGPGEFSRPYRITPDPRGGALVYDGVTMLISRFDSAGLFVDRHKLDVLFAQVDDLLALKSGGIAMTGVVRSLTGAPSRAVTSAVHVFDSSGKHVRSFAPLPDARDPGVLQYWGAGYLSADPDGSLWFARKLPYELLRYTTNGLSRQRIPVALAGRLGPDDFVKVVAIRDSARGRGTRVTPSQLDIPVPARVVLLGDRYLVTGLLGRNSKTLDVVDRVSGKVIASAPMPAGAHMLLGYDQRRSALWFTGDVDDEPVLFRQRIELMRR